MKTHNAGGKLRAACGPHRDDPRTNAERKLLCGDCVEDWNR